LFGIRVWTFSFSSLSPAAFGPASLICWFKFLIRLLPFARPISRVKSVPSLGIAFRRFAAARALLAVTFFLARAAVSFSPFLILALKTSGFCVRVSREVVLYEALIFPL
jgi:hypothetical protein